MRYFFVILYIAVFKSFALCAQPVSDLKPQGAGTVTNATEAGRIVFTSEAVKKERLSEKDYLKTYTLTNKSNLFITVFLRNTITHNLHLMEPRLSDDELAKKGNMQFSLQIDGKTIYSSNLIPGAPSRKIRDSALMLSVPLINNNNQGWYLWSQSFWMRFIINGGDKALTEGRHLLTMEIRPYINTGNEIKVGGIIASGSLDINVNLKPMIDTSRIALNKVKPYNDLETSKSAFESDLIKLLKGNIEEGVYKNISSVVVLKEGKILIEEYFNGETRDTLHDPRSVGKSFASTMTGIAIGEGYLKSEEQKLKEFYDIRSYANYSPLKEDVTIKDLLTMNSSFEGNDDDGDSPGNEDNMYSTPDWVKFALDLPVNQAMKKDWHYFTAGVVILGDILDKKVPGGLDKYSAEKLFIPLGITDYKWQYTPQNVPNTAGGIRMNALDFAKFGQLYKNMGHWNGKQIIPEKWVEKSFTKHLAITGRIEEYYGYLFWNKTYIVNGKPYETFYCAGNGGNKIFVFPKQPLVVVITATAYGAPYAHTQEDQMMEKFILPAVLNDKK